jgi:hypothetical protein
MQISKLFKVGVAVAAVALIAIAAGAVFGGAGLPDPAYSCVASSRFLQGETVVFRIKVTDPATGSNMDDKALTSVVVTLKDGQTFKARYGGHPGGQGATPTDYFWSAAWKIPADYATGSVPYQVTATGNDGRTGTFSEFNVASSLLQVVAAQ